MTQFSIQWILSLNRLSQEWGQVQIHAKVNPDLKPNYTKFYIGLTQGNRPNTFVTLRPRKKSCLVGIRLADVDQYRSKLQSEGSLEPLPGNSKGGWLRFHLNEGQVKEFESLLAELLQKIYEESISQFFCFSHLKKIASRLRSTNSASLT